MLWFIQIAACVISWHSWITFQCIVKIHSVCSHISWWIFEFFLLPGSYRSCCVNSHATARLWLYALVLLCLLPRTKIVGFYITLFSLLLCLIARQFSRVVIIFYSHQQSYFIRVPIFISLPTCCFWGSPFLFVFDDSDLESNGVRMLAVPTCVRHSSLLFLSFATALQVPRSYTGGAISQSQKKCGGERTGLFQDVVKFRE